MSIASLSSLSQLPSSGSIVNPVSVFIKFHALWCDPCVKVVGPLVSKLSKNLSSESFHFYEVDVDSDVASDLVDFFGVETVPTCIYLVNGVEVHRFVGSFSEREFASLLAV